MEEPVLKAFFPGQGSTTSGEADDRSDQDLKRRPNVAVFHGADHRCSRAAVERTCGGSAKDSFSVSTRNGIFKVPVPQMIEQLVDVPKIVFQDRINRWTAEQIVDMPVFNDFPRTVCSPVMC